MKICRVICSHRSSPVVVNPSKLCGALFRKTKVQSLGSWHQRSHVVNSTLGSASRYRHRGGAFQVGLRIERAIVIQFVHNIRGSFALIPLRSILDLVIQNEEGASANCTGKKNSCPCSKSILRVHRLQEFFFMVKTLKLRHDLRHFVRYSY